MADSKKQNIEQNESNAERDRDEGSMNNGTIGGNMEKPGSSSKPGDTEGIEGSKATSGQGDGGKEENI